MVMLPALSEIFSTTVSSMPRCTQPARASDAALARRAKISCYQSVDRAVQIGVFEHKGWANLPPSSSVVTAKFSAEFRIT